MIRDYSRADMDSRRQRCGRVHTGLKGGLQRLSHDWQNESLNRNFAMINHVSQRDRFSWLISESRFFASFWLS
jgi:hypothetical protein